MNGDKVNILSYNIQKCTGCTACSHVCPKKCITMRDNPEGFMYPTVDETYCIQCGKCIKVCPNFVDSFHNKPQRVFAAKNRNTQIRQASSSGGVFYEIAKQFVSSGGIVYGCSLDDNMVARHIAVRNIEELRKLRNSKYVQSDMGNVLPEIKWLLASGERVLFSGTPCQTAGLRNYLGKEYTNLFIVDVLCHGVPSPKLFAEYISYIREKFDNGRPISVNFRSKQKGWHHLSVDICFDNGMRYLSYGGYDYYQSLYLNNISLRSSCYECLFANEERVGDISLGDFWGIENRYPKWDDNIGVSLVLLNTPKGMALFQPVSCLFDLKEETFNFAKNGQTSLSIPAKKPPDRDAFYRKFVDCGFLLSAKQFSCVPSIARRCLIIFVSLLYRPFAILRRRIER